MSTVNKPVHLLQTFTILGMFTLGSSEFRTNSGTPTVLSPKPYQHRYVTVGPFVVSVLNQDVTKTQREKWDSQRTNTQLEASGPIHMEGEVDEGCGMGKTCEGRRTNCVWRSAVREEIEECLYRLRSFRFREDCL